MWAPWGIKLDDNLCAWLDELRKVALAEMDDIDRIKELERLRLRNCGDLDEQRSQFTTEVRDRNGNSNSE